MAARVAAQSAPTGFDGVDCLRIAVSCLCVQQVERIENIIVKPGLSRRDAQNFELRRALTHVSASQGAEVFAKIVNVLVTHEMTISILIKVARIDSAGHLIFRQQFIWNEVSGAFFFTLFLVYRGICSESIKILAKVGNSCNFTI